MTWNERLTPHKLNMKVLTEVDKTGSQVCDTLVWSLAYCCGRRLTRTNSLVYTATRYCYYLSFSETVKTVTQTRKGEG